ncbi:LacI family DNA-binding transcriptional regulator [Paenibacillus sp. J2TS4]|uniref:LacI family DNA-binding transcriptional regulator n=1 Tax=Paenibacillus sp. J2TS4 TaxID=2807194 RepID=UPI001B244487|nr:LacI family DNA-binding transcriptional regulator [Paenibacillus sp. J2TS4]GIP31406.1 LacI family transcriptional regulator [Paenibacillus sp. J2TS4]
MQPTIKDVAKRAGVSVGTASKVINGGGNVKPELKERVRRAVKELNYLPNAVARSLKSSNTHTVAVLLADVTNPFQMTLAKGIEDVMYKRDYQLLISSTKENVEIERKNLMMLYEKRVDGIIVCTTGQANDEIRAIIRRHIPVVLVDRPVYSLATDIVADNSMVGMELLVQHLVELGHRRIGVVHGDLNTIHGKIRHDSVQKALERFQLPMVPELQYTGGFSYSGGASALEHFIALDDPPTALLSANNNMTAGIMKACRHRDIHIPDDMTLVSFGELEYNWNLITPSVTHVSQSPLIIGQKAAELLLNRLQNEGKEEVSHVFYTPELIIAESSAQKSANR